MRQIVQSFETLSTEEQPRAGGKGGTLARLYQAGYPVPDGFVILPGAFAGDELTAEGWAQVRAQIGRMRNGESEMAFAVRSSAMSEDAAQASFAGEFETVLDVHTDEMIREGIRTVRRSRQSERVEAYSRTQGIDAAHDMAVVVQRLIRADISGVLFTADPVTGSHLRMSGNYIHGLGDELVSGKAEPYTFSLRRPKGQYEGPPELKRLARELYRLAARLEKDLGCPQDIEWAVADGRLYLLQSRPITTLIGHNRATGKWNDSLTGDYLWSRNNFGEGRPDVMSPLTWSLANATWSEISFLPGYSMAGNICGRYYANISVAVSMLRAMGKSTEAAIEQMADLLGSIPEGLEIPLVPLSRWTLLTSLPRMVKLARLEKQGAKRIPEFLATNQEWCRRTQQQFQALQDGEDLHAWWLHVLKPRMSSMMWLVGGSAQPLEASRKLHHELTELVGEADANALLSNFSDVSAMLASLGPAVGIAKVARGETSRQEYLELYGHRGPQEAELSAPRPAEDPAWFDKQLEEFHRSPVDIDALLAKRRAGFDTAWQRFQARYPRKAMKMRRRIDEVGPAGRLREDVRSEITRFYGVVRAWAVRAGELTSLGDGVFFLHIDELLDVLSGKDSATRQIEARKATFDRYSELPPYPMIIRGRFDPFQWAADPNRRGDIYDAYAPVPVATSDVITGFAGAAGRVEGQVRVLDGPEQGDQLLPGEILVAVTTNVGWTPMFPRAAAIVTDVGAPLSHAAIVARELGIPAVVGCAQATTRLRTGDRVLVDGGRGVVEILEA